MFTHSLQFELQQKLELKPELAAARSASKSAGKLNANVNLITVIRAYKKRSLSLRSSTQLPAGAAISNSSSICSDPWRELLKCKRVHIIRLIVISSATAS